jgi:hypothetical protein
MMSAKPPCYQSGGILLCARPALAARRARRPPLQAGEGIPFHLVLDLAQIEPVRRPNACCGKLTLADRSPNGIRTHANEGREFFDRQI